MAAVIAAEGRGAGGSFGPVGSGKRRSVTAAVLASAVVQGAGSGDDLSIYDDPSKDVLAKGRARRDRSRAGNVIAVVLLVGALLLSTYIYMIPRKETMTIDGEFSDWNDVSLYHDDDGDAAYSGINIISTGAVREGDRLFLYVEVIGTIFDTRTDGGSVQVFIDSDGSSRSGYHILGIGAEYLVEVYGREGGVVTSNYYRYTDRSFGHENRAWNWSHISHIPSRARNRRIEIAMPYHNGDDALLVFRVSDDRGNEDLSSVLPLVHEERKAPLMITTGPRIGEGTVLSPDSAYDLIDVDLDVKRGSCKVTNLTVMASGTVTDTDVGQISLMREGTAIDSRLLSDGTAVLRLGDLDVLGETRLTIRATIAPQASPGTVLTMAVSDVATNSRAVTSDLQGSSWYLSTPPDGYVIDGLFHEWQNASEDERGDARRNVDITGYKGARSMGKVYFYLGVDGEMMAGAWIPASRPMAVEGGSGSQEELPLALPESDDAVYIFLGVHPVVEGYRPQGFPVTANRLLVVKGYQGEVREAHHFRYSGDAPPDWPWVEDEATVRAANGLSELELSVDRDYLDFEFYVHFTTWRNNTGDTTAPLSISGSTGEDDPFALTRNGSAHWSQTGRSWEPLTALPEGVEYTDIAIDDDGTVFILQSNGSVLSAASADSGWIPYGTGGPAEGDGFVGIARSSSDGSVLTLRSDGEVYRTSGVDDSWHPVAERKPPGGHVFTDIALTDGDTALVALRNDGAVFTTSGSENWALYAPAAADGPGAGSVGIGADSSGQDAVVGVLSNSGSVHLSTGEDSDWTVLSSIGLPDSAAFSDIAMENGSVTVLMNDGTVHLHNDGRWQEYGAGDPSIPKSTAYIGLAAMERGPDLKVAVLGNSGAVHTTADEFGGWKRHGTGAPSAPELAAYADIAADPAGVHSLASDGLVLTSVNGGGTWTPLADAGDDASWTSVASAGTHLYALRNDGSVSRISTSDGSVEEWGDAGADSSWVSIATDGSYVYAIRTDGMTAVRSMRGTSWSSKGDAGDGTFWVSIGTSTASPFVYAMDGSRRVVRAPGGTDINWTEWAPSGSGTGWVSLAAGEYYLFALNADGSVDRALMTTSEWDVSFGEVDDVGMTGMDAVVVEEALPEFALLAPLGGIIAAFCVRRRR